MKQGKEILFVLIKQNKSKKKKNSKPKREKTLVFDTQAIIF